MHTDMHTHVPVAKQKEDHGTFSGSFSTTLTKIRRLKFESTIHE